MRFRSMNTRLDLGQRLVCTWNRHSDQSAHREVLQVARAGRGESTGDTPVHRVGHRVQFGELQGVSTRTGGAYDTRDKATGHAGKNEMVYN